MGQFQVAQQTCFPLAAMADFDCGKHYHPDGQFFTSTVATYILMHGYVLCEAVCACIFLVISIMTYPYYYVMCRHSTDILHAMEVANCFIPHFP